MQTSVFNEAFLPIAQGKPRADVSKYSNEIIQPEFVPRHFLSFSRVVAAQEIMGSVSRLAFSWAFAFLKLISMLLELLLE